MDTKIWGTPGSQSFLFSETCRPQFCASLVTSNFHFWTGSTLRRAKKFAVWELLSFDSALTQTERPCNHLYQKLFGNQTWTFWNAGQGSCQPMHSYICFLRGSHCVHSTCVPGLTNFFCNPLTSRKNLLTQSKKQSSKSGSICYVRQKFNFWDCCTLFLLFRARCLCADHNAVSSLGSFCYFR